MGALLTLSLILYPPPLAWYGISKSLFVLYLFELTVIRAAAGQGPLEKSPSPCLLTDPSVLHQPGFVPSRASGPWKEPPIKPLEPVKSEATLECLF